MAEKKRRGKNDIGGGARGSLSTKPVVEILLCASNHLRWLSWFGGNFNQNMIIAMNQDPDGEEPPMPGVCGLPTVNLRVRDLVKLVNTTETEVAHVVKRLLGTRAHQHGDLTQLKPASAARPLRRRARR